MEPWVAKKGPSALTLDTGPYWCCACGLSKTQTYCDGSHKGTGLAPVKFTVTDQEQVVLCQCKQSRNKPFGNGTRKRL